MRSLAGTASASTAGEKKDELPGAAGDGATAEELGGREGLSCVLSHVGHERAVMVEVEQLQLIKLVWLNIRSWSFLALQKGSFGFTSAVETQV